MKTYVLETFGCQMNVHDSARIEDVLAAEGYVASTDRKCADLILINTCSVREKAEHKLMSLLGTLRPLKMENPALTIAVAGCVAQQEGGRLIEKAPYVDIVLGPDNIGDLPGLLRRVELGEPPLVHTRFDLESPAFLSARSRNGQSPVCAYVTVMKGCDERCTFCIVPTTRGPERYRSADEIVAEVDRLVAEGTREVTLLGQTVNSWHEPGVDVAPVSEFARLLRRITAEVPGLCRLRYTSPHPRHVTDALLAAHRELEVLAPHVHLPVQSGSNRVLRRMSRKYTRELYLERAAALRACREGLTLSTDVIVGFPGETEDDFEQTLSLVREAGFVAAFGFKYSPRPNTPALNLSDDVPEEVKADRLARFFSAVEAQQTAHLHSLVGTRQQVLIDGPSRATAHRFAGRSARHEIIHVDVPAGADPTGLLLDVDIVEAYGHSLSGRLREPLPARPPRARIALPVVSSEASA